MAYKKFVYEIITNLFTQSFMLSPSLTHLCPSNSLRSSYQTHRFNKIQITKLFPINFKYMFTKIVCLYREKKNIAKNQLGYRLDHKLKTQRQFSLLSTSIKIKFKLVQQLIIIDI